MSVKRLAQILFPAFLFAAALNGCGSGAVSSPNTVSGELLVLPATAELFPNTTTTFTISGGRPGYSAFSSNGAILPITETVSGNQFSVTPNDVAVDTAVTITVRDRDNTTKTVAATVKLATLSSTVTFTPVNPSPNVNCGTGAVMCGGGEALLQVRAVQNGVPLANRALRFEVVNGQFNFITSVSGSVASTHTINTDSNGSATVSIRASAGVATQAAILRYTDVTSGQIRTFGFTIAQFLDGAPVLTVIPSAYAWQGADNTKCAADVTTTHYIFGGRPPYTIASTVPDFATIAPTVVNASGGGVNVTVSGKVCTVGATGNAFTITDQNGRTAVFTVANTVGTTPPPAPPAPAPLLFPSALTLACGQSAAVVVVASGSVGVASESPGQVEAVLNAGTISITRRTTSSPGPADTPPNPSFAYENDSVLVRVSDGRSVSTLTVVLTLKAAGPGRASCP
jgi:hypothetical protein